VAAVAVAVAAAAEVVMKKNSKGPASSNDGPFSWMGWISPDHR
jgi:hypothetical protein